MSTLPVFSRDGQKSGRLSLNPKLFAVRPNRALLHQVAVGLLANQRRATAHTKTRGEVRGGGRKPWRQKGTGKARAGSIRSPLWRGGGTVFGPRNVRNYAHRLPAAMKRAAFRQVLAEKVRRGEVVVLANLPLSHPKTKVMEELFTKLPIKEGRILLLIEEATEALRRATANLPYLTLRTPTTVNVLDLLLADSIVTTKAALTALEERYANA